MRKYASLQLFGLACLILILVPRGYAGTDVELMRVQLQIGGDERVRSKIKGCFRRNLLALGNVEIVQKNPNIQVYVLGRQHERRDFGTGDRYSITVLAGAPLVASDFDFISDEVERRTARLVSRGALRPKAWGIRTGLDLRELCEFHVADLDALLRREREADRWDREALIGTLQQHLSALGYSPGSQDGVLGRKTGAAIRAYQRDHGMPIDGEYSHQLLQHVIGTRDAEAYDY